MKFSELATERTPGSLCDPDWLGKVIIYTKFSSSSGVW